MTAEEQLVVYKALYETTHEMYQGLMAALRDYLDRSDDVPEAGHAMPSNPLRFARDGGNVKVWISEPDNWQQFTVERFKELFRCECLSHCSACGRTNVL